MVANGGSDLKGAHVNSTRSYTQRYPKRKRSARRSNELWLREPSRGDAALLQARGRSLVGFRRMTRRDVGGPRAVTYISELPFSLCFIYRILRLPSRSSGSEIRASAWYTAPVNTSTCWFTYPVLPASGREKRARGIRQESTKKESSLAPDTRPESGPT